MKIEAVPACLKRMDEWVHELATLLPDPIKAPVPGYDFRWKYPVETPEIVLVIKCVRVTTSLAGAWHVANLGLTTESGSLCRQIDDFASEVWFVVEGMLKGEKTSAHETFIKEFFDPAATNVEAYLARERRRYVSRADIGKAGERPSREAGQDAEQFKNLSSYITYGLNKYTHGSYESAMELYHGGFRRFMLLGAEGRPREAAIRFVGSKATEACYAIGGAALAMGKKDIFDAIRSFVLEVDPSVRADGDRTGADIAP
jgi:hypothetical protein